MEKKDNIQGQMDNVSREMKIKKIKRIARNQNIVTEMKNAFYQPIKRWARLKK